MPGRADPAPCAEPATLGSADGASTMKAISWNIARPSRSIRVKAIWSAAPLRAPGGVGTR